MPKSIQEIKAEFEGTDLSGRERLCRLYEADGRAGVLKLIEKTRKEKEKLDKEYARIEGMLSYEKEYGSFSCICGIDEAGRGPLAGPVVAGAVILPKDSRILYLNDSKKLTPGKRDELFDIIMEEAVSVGVGVVDAGRIDEINILQATYEAMREAISKLSCAPDLLLNDAVTIPGVDVPQVPIIKGDAKSLSIAAASVIAKVTRDRMMAAFDELYPGYGFGVNKGYGTKEHIEKLKACGPSPIHRATFIKNFCALPSVKPEAPRANYRARGSFYEEAAAACLAREGYNILENNYRCKAGEIDLIAREGGYLVFIEVKYRATEGSGFPAQAVDREKQQRIIKAAKWYLTAHGIMPETPVRFDVVGICGSDVKIYKNAFCG